MLKRGEHDNTERGGNSMSPAPIAAMLQPSYGYPGLQQSSAARGAMPGTFPISQGDSFESQPPWRQSTRFPYGWPTTDPAIDDVDDDLDDDDEDDDEDEDDTEI